MNIDSDSLKAWVSEREGHAFAGSFGGVVDEYLATLTTPTSPRVIPVGEDGQLTCTCGSTSFKENGSHPCDWGFSHQDTDEKRLVLDGSFEWYEGTFDSYECTSCGKDYDALPEGWDTDYA